MLCKYALSKQLSALNFIWFWEFCVTYGYIISKGDISFGSDFYKEHRRMKISYTVTIRFLSSEDEDDFLSRWGPGDFCNAFTLVSEPGNEAGGVADKPVVEPKLVKGKMYPLKEDQVC